MFQCDVIDWKLDARNKGHSQHLNVISGLLCRLKDDWPNIQSERVVGGREEHSQISRIYSIDGGDTYLNHPAGGPLPVSAR